MLVISQTIFVILALLVLLLLSHLPKLFNKDFCPINIFLFFAIKSSTRRIILQFMTKTMMPNLFVYQITAIFEINTLFCYLSFEQ